jgi:hypothetical protein
MKRLLAPILTIALLAFCASAYACDMTVHAGSAFSAPTATGNCSVSKVLKTASLSCGSGSGAATVVYAFKLPDGCGPSVSPHVDWTGAKPGVAVKTIRSSVRVTVRLSGPSRSTLISMVSISYLC